MSIEALLAVGCNGEDKVSPLAPSKVEWLESRIDQMSETLPPFRGFTIPGGDRLISQCHICRTVCRRAERQILTAAEQHPVDERVMGYINRLSDLLYTLSQHCAQRLGKEEKLWVG